MAPLRQKIREARLAGKTLQQVSDEYGMSLTKVWSLTRDLPKPSITKEPPYLRESAIIQWLKEHPDEIEDGLIIVDGYWFQGDIFGLDREGYPVIIEVKRKSDTHSVAEGVGELLLYETMLEEFFKESEARGTLEGILLAWSDRIASRKKARDIKTQKIRKILIIPSEDNKMTTTFIKVCEKTSIEIKIISLNELERR